MRQQVLIDGATATDATKLEFVLRGQDFQGQSLPCLKGRGYGAGDSSKIYERVNGGWNDSGQVIDNSTLSVTIQACGRYAVDLTMTTGGPVHLQLDSSGTGS